MTTLDLNAYGVTEMSHAEKVAENGGLLMAAACVTLAVAFIAGQTIALYHGLNPEGSHGQKLH